LTAYCVVIVFADMWGVLLARDEDLFEPFMTCGKHF